MVTLEQVIQPLLAQFKLGVQPGPLARGEMVGHRMGTSCTDDAQERRPRL
jgi:hypothetical protein